MPSFDRLLDPPKKGKVIKSGFDSQTFDADCTIHVEGFVGSATISPSNRDVALASPDGLAIIDLDSPWSPPRRLSSHGLPWLVVDVQWSPFAARDYWVASTANHRCLVWNLNMRDDSPSGAIEHSLQGHSRAITDINFSAHHPDLLGTCSVDGYVHCWDLRRPRQPALTFCDWFAGATQVKYNRQDSHIVASAHDRWLHIWDDRKPVEPLHTINAHTSKIYGIDWNRTRASSLVTCSLDKSIKFWDYGKGDEMLERTIRTDFPVWRARHTPFGWGLLAMPQNEPGNLYLYDRIPAPGAPTDGPADPVAVFPGHGNHKVKEFLWRSRGGVTSEGLDDREFQLVSWGEDNELRLQKVEPNILESVGYVRGRPLRKNLNITRKGATYKTFRTVDDHAHRDRRNATMSDPRPGSGGQYRRSALSMGLHSRLGRGPSWRGSSMKANVNSGKKVDKSQLQIGWMKGVTMTKKRSASHIPGRSGLKDSGLFSPDYEDDWGEPETIQDEFLRISNQFPNVKWENIDMDNLTLNASLKGPWGTNEETIFIKVKVDIPTSYPKNKSPRFIIEKTSFMPDETRKKIEHELHTLAHQFLERKQNCLDVVFSYLLGEVDLENSTSFFKNVRDLYDEIEALADESSSEEDESDIPAGGSASMSQELTASMELDPEAILAPTQRVAAPPPPPRLCGARFSNDGRLVCFFPTRDEKQKGNPNLFGMSGADRERQKGEPTFAGFGRLAHNSPPPKHRYNDDTSATDDQSSESEDSESTSSSDSEPTTMHKINLWYQPGRRFRKTWSANESMRSSGGGTGAGTGTGTGTSRKRPSKPKNTLSIHDLRSELPSKKQFAQEYAIFGDGADVCKHNAKVAEKYGYLDLVHVWSYAALLLRNDIPLEVHQQKHRKESVLVIARDAVARARLEEEQGIHTSLSDTNLAGRVRWGYHPFAQELISDLFEYFERIADIQMLAMLACIFGDSSAEDGVAYAESHLTQPETPLPMKAPSFSLEYFPTDPALWNINYKSQASSAITTPRTAHTPAMYSGSQVSEEMGGVIEPASNSYSCGETPPRISREHNREVDQTQSLSTSPSNRFFHRSNSAVAAAFTVSLPRTLTGIISGSPPDPPARKRPSPAEAILSNLAPSAITWGASTVFGNATAETTPGTARTSLSDDDWRSDDLFTMVPVAVSCVPENQGLFDDDGWMSTPLLEPSRSNLYSMYRYAYAEMLQMWGQPLSRLEIMKFNVLKEDSNDTSFAASAATYGTSETAGNHHDVSSSHTTTTGTGTGADNSAATGGTTSPTVPFGGRKEQMQALLASDRGLDVTGICRIHEIKLEPIEYSRATNGLVGGAVGTCPRCGTQPPPTSSPASRRGAGAHPRGSVRTAPPQTQLKCVFCLEPIDALYPPCLGCGCASHEACLAEWHAAGEVECPAGDDCVCVEEASNGQLESWLALQAAVNMARMRDKAARSIGVDGVPSGGGSGSDDRGDSHARRSSIRSLGAALAAGGIGGRPRRRSVPADLAKFVGVGKGRKGAGGDDEEEDETATPATTTSSTTASVILDDATGGSGVAGMLGFNLGIGGGAVASAPGSRRGSKSRLVGLGNGGGSSSNGGGGALPSGTGNTRSALRHNIIGGGDDFDDDDNGIDREDWESVASSHGIPSVGNNNGAPVGGSGGVSGNERGSQSYMSGGKPPPYGDEPISAARLSLGNRLKKSLGDSSRPSALRRKSGGVNVWKTLG